ncbi:methyltransferase domain-containing protein [Streptomyces bathyalis]|uniref:Methyltransferase domain-containing protein n=1 Tax=Streptomyces bathyalis TaxID=2710756 RepID=A0A7T1T330_9ACTN|nr:class I SAM-dependent methyltransferase [Streptomyces bathyalis]QPP05519.1 methyltransferase domain-containing protein [Streptomyces bathyalis]
MDGTLAVFLRKLYQEGRQHDEPLADRLQRLRNMTPAASSLISLLIRAQGSRDVLEIGTSNGYSAIWFADALRDTGGRLVSVETEKSRVDAARENLERADVSEYAEVLHGDGGQVLAGAGDASLDLVALDAERPAYEAYWPDLRRVLRPHGIIAVDNAVSHGEQLTGFRGLLEDDPSFAVSLQKTGDGVLTAVRTGARGG